MLLVLGYETLEAYQRLSYKHWYAFAEFIDNSTQSYRNHKNELDKIYQDNGNLLTVDISFNNSRTDGFISIKDNAYGMSESELKNALILGKKPVNNSERSKYGMGLKTASFWFGKKWRITTSKYGEAEELTVTIDLLKILEDEKKHYETIKKEGKELVQFVPDLGIISEPCDEKRHFTEIHITSLNRNISSRIAKNCIEHLQSIYRIDLQNGELYLTFQDEVLSWNSSDLENQLLTDENDEPYKRDLNFEINDTTITGWAGILKNGSRKNAGFSLLQADRVIMGYPDNFKPTLLFGDQEGGTNNLVNQRLTGELYLDGFDVSHTKDQILFKDEEADELNIKLFELLADFKTKAESYRHPDVEFDFDSYIKEVLDTLRTSKYKDVIFRSSILPHDVIINTNEEVVRRILNLNHVKFECVIDNLVIHVLMSEESSPYDPYLIVKTNISPNNLTIVINKMHPYWSGLSNKEAYTFLISCIYDGVSEWKAQFLASTIDPDTIKNIKDQLLRLQLTIN